MTWTTFSTETEPVTATVPEIVAEPGFRTYTDPVTMKAPSRSTAPARSKPSGSTKPTAVPDRGSEELYAVWVGSAAAENEAEKLPPTRFTLMLPPGPPPTGRTTIPKLSNGKLDDVCIASGNQDMARSPDNYLLLLVSS